MYRENERTFWKTKRQRQQNNEEYEMPKKQKTRNPLKSCSTKKRSLSLILLATLSSLEVSLRPKREKKKQNKNETKKINCIKVQPNITHLAFCSSCLFQLPRNLPPCPCLKTPVYWISQGPLTMITRAVYPLEIKVTPKGSICRPCSSDAQYQVGLNLLIRRTEAEGSLCSPVSIIVKRYDVPVC